MTLLLLLQYRLWFGDSNIRQYFTIEQQYRKQLTINERLKNKNKRLERKVFFLKHHPEAIEELARFELGMIKPGETYYQVIEPVE